MAKTIEEAKKEIEQQERDGEYLTALKDIEKNLNDPYGSDDVFDLKWQLKNLVEAMIKDVYHKNQMS